MVFLSIKIKFNPLLLAYSFFSQYLLLEKKQTNSLCYFGLNMVGNLSKKVILENNPINTCLYFFQNQHSKYQYIFFQKQNNKII